MWARKDSTSSRQCDFVFVEFGNKLNKKQETMVNIREFTLLKNLVYGAQKK